MERAERGDGKRGTGDMGERGIIEWHLMCTIFTQMFVFTGMYMYIVHAHVHNVQHNVIKKKQSCIIHVHKHTHKHMISTFLQ